MYIDVSTVCPCVSWPPLSTIVTLLLRWASYCVCTSNARCDAFLYCLILLVRIYSELRELLSVDASLYTNDGVLLLRECPRSAWSNELYVHIFLTCAHRRESGESSVRATSIMHMCLSLVSSIRPSVMVVGSMWYCQTVWKAHRVFALGTVYCDWWLWEYLRWQSVSRKWGPFTQVSMSCLCVDVLYLIFNYFCHVLVRSLFHASTMSKVAVKLLVNNCFVPMSAVALCSGRQSPFLEVRFDRRLPRREAEHPSPYCPIPYGAKRYT